ncbi:MAG TPA: EAL domain-containing protein [Thermoleophilaceae bacterium]|nr:EAL domain-containing protein [Thermoleophilaceae bacterium]
MSTTVLLADDDPEFREALTAVVRRAPSLELVAIAENALDAIELGRLEQPDVAVIDVRMPDGGGARVAKELQKVAPQTMVLALSAYGDEATVMQMLDAGAAGYLLKGVSAAELVDAIERTADHQSVISPGVNEGPDGEPLEPTTVIVADEDKEALDALASIIDRASDFALVGKARDATTAVRLAALYTPDIALVDASMPGGGGAIAAAQIRLGSPATRVIALSASPERDIVLQMLRAGASSYVVKSVPAQDLLTALRATAAADDPGLVVNLDAAETRAEPVKDPRARVRAVIEGPGLSMVFQPIVNIQGHGVVGVEALARFEGQPRQSPDVWFNDAAASGLGTEMDLAAVRAALAVLPRLPSEVDLFMNVVPETLFSSDFDELVSTMPGERIVLELTEHAPVHDYDQLAEAIGGLRARGFRIAVDDVGAGYSSFRHLLTVHPDVLKIDISLCRSIESDRARQVIAASIASLGRELDATVVAEGIETWSELTALRELGIDAAQGFYLARPGPPPLDGLLAEAATNGATT